MKRRYALLPALMFIIVLSACSGRPEAHFGFSKHKFTVVEEQDTHGGFHGDGSYSLILDCSDHAEEALEIVDGWNSLPLSENLGLLLFGGEKNGIYMFGLSEGAQIPNIENGWYRFQDRHPQAKDPSDDSELLGRSSFNFSLAVYDSDTNMLYYFEFDT